MARPKRSNPVGTQARSYIHQYAPELDDAPMQLRQLDGPPSSPRFLVTAERCCAPRCPYGVPPAVVEANGCSVHSCPLRCAVQLLLSREGGLIQIDRNGIHWG